VKSYGSQDELKGQSQSSDNGNNCQIAIQNHRYQQKKGGISWCLLDSRKESPQGTKQAGGHNLKRSGSPSKNGSEFAVRNHDLFLELYRKHEKTP
jgi:hypothetical protein